MRLGVEQGQSVVTMAHNSHVAVHCRFGINLAGAVEVAINTAYRGISLAHALRAIEARWVILESGFLPLLAEIEEEVPQLTSAIVIGSSDAVLKRVKVLQYEDIVQPGAAHEAHVASPAEVASVIYTSGTSGPSKPVLLTHAANLHAAAQIVRGLRLTREDVYYCVHPLFHQAGKTLAVVAQMLVGGKVVLDARFSAASWLRRVIDCEATVTVAHGPMLEMIYAEPRSPQDRASRLRATLACPLPKRIGREFEERFGILGLEAYGMTEIGIAAIRPIDEPLRPGSCGTVDQERYELRIADPDTDTALAPGEVGEIQIRPKQEWTLMQGYAGMPEATVRAWRNLWFHSGDAAFLDADGYLHFVDRIGDRIRRRAENISSYDIEAAALAHPEVAEAAAVGVPSEFEADDDIKLCIVGASDREVDLAGLLAYLATRLPHYMVPRYVEQLDALPRTPTNKIRKQVLRAGGVVNAWDRKAHGIDLRGLAGRA